MPFHVTFSSGSDARKGEEGGVEETDVGCNPYDRARGGRYRKQGRYGK